MKFVKRRELLKFGAIGCAIALSGCGGSDRSEDSSAVWDPSSSLVFTAGSGNVRVDLTQTLPSGVIRGGTFSLSPTSRPLPAGVTLSAQGILTAVSPVAGITSDIVFAYTEPA